MCGARRGVWSSEMTHQPQALPCIAQGRPGVRYARRKGHPPQGEVGGGRQAPHSSEQGVREKRMSSWRCGEAGAPTLHS